MSRSVAFRLSALILLGAAVLVVIAACASAGRRIDRTHLDDVEVGEQDRVQIRAWFGDPYAIQTGLSGHPKGCTERWKFEYAEAQGFGTVTYTEVLVVDFDEDGVVCDHAFSKSGED